MRENYDLGIFDFDDFAMEMTSTELLLVNGGACGGGFSGSSGGYSGGSCGGGGSYSGGYSGSYSGGSSSVSSSCGGSSSSYSGGSSSVSSSCGGSSSSYSGSSSSVSSSCGGSSSSYSGGSSSASSSCGGSFNGGSGTSVSYGNCGGGTIPISNNCGGGYTGSGSSYTSSDCGAAGDKANIQTTVGYSKLSHALVEGVGFVSENIQQGCYTDSNNILTVSNMGFFSGKDNSASVESYNFFGEITLILNGREIETKRISPPNGSNVWNGDYEYIGNVTFDTPIPNYGSVEIKSNIDMSVNNAFVNFATNVNKIR